ncbi:ABC transporter ATP-binding protein [Actinacidiphila epipremni]|uniref:ABC transporter ATP-binding protein n=1 Tax=Actinacidiphila epipremni TaxID=2053013 RepID=A0ABX0ZXL0_9ACTN|nr:ABC transporter ATP-binding protein [Actinacidiphila epipremni]NJP47931.1 ABC transporter ATP-binding protein [Actinacidiphila epipremni]
MLSIAKVTKDYTAPGGRTPKIPAGRKPPAPGPGAADGGPVTAPALRGIDLEVEQGQFHTLLGPSGCGKTTLLRSIAGLERPDSGTITLSGTTMFSSDQGIDVTPDRRDLGMVFQSYAIWPHMDVFKNVAFPLTVRRPGRTAPRLTRAEQRARVEEALAAVGLADYAGRQATNLSGGQQQRLAVARALVTRPALVLLDEPLSNLDARLRESMRFELKRLQRETGVTMVYVTHDQAEALALSDVVTVMSQGRIEQSAPPQDVYDQPASLFVAEFVGAPNLVRGVVEHVADGAARVASDAGAIAVARCGLAAGERVRVLMRPEDFTVAAADRAPADGGAGHNTFDGVVVATAFEGERVRQQIRVGALTVECHAQRHLALPDGTAVRLSIAAAQVRLVPETADGGTAAADPDRYAMAGSARERGGR